MNEHTSKRKKTLVGILAAVGVIVFIAALIVFFSDLEKKNDTVPEGAGVALSRERDRQNEETQQNGGNGTTAGSPADDDRRAEDGDNAGAILYNGTKFMYNDRLVSLLILGTDKQEIEEYIPSENDSHVDFIVLAVFDPETKTCTLLQLNRDTMCDVFTMESDEQYDYVSYEQLSYAHAYGNGKEESCENTVKTVSDLLYGAKIDNYFCLTMDAIPVLNDLVGGVTVTIEDDFSEIDPTLVMGETVTLTAENVEHYVRGRMGVGDGKNLSRMRRQTTYMTGLIDAMKTAVNEKSGFVLEAYGAVADSLVTDCTINDLSDYASRFSEYTLAGIVSPEGVSVRGQQYMEFYLDEEALQELVINTFYKPLG